MLSDFDEYIEMVIKEFLRMNLNVDMQFILKNFIIHEDSCIPDFLKLQIEQMAAKNLIEDMPQPKC